MSCLILWRGRLGRKKKSVLEQNRPSTQSQWRCRLGKKSRPSPKQKKALRKHERGLPAKRGTTNQRNRRKKAISRE